MLGVDKATAGKLTDESLSTQFGAAVGTLQSMAPELAGFSVNPNRRFGATKALRCLRAPRQPGQPVQTGHLHRVCVGGRLPPWSTLRCIAAAESRANHFCMRRAHG